MDFCRSRASALCVSVVGCCAGIGLQRLRRRIVVGGKVMPGNVVSGIAEVAGAAVFGGDTCGTQVVRERRLLATNAIPGEPPGVALQTQVFASLCGGSGVCSAPSPAPAGTAEWLPAFAARQPFLDVGAVGLASLPTGVQSRCFSVGDEDG